MCFFVDGRNGFLKESETITMWFPTVSTDVRTTVYEFVVTKNVTHTFSSKTQKAEKYF